MLDLEILSVIYLGDKHDFDGSARENTSEPVCKNSYWIPRQPFPFVYGHWKDYCLDRILFCGKKGHMKASVYLDIYTSYTDALEGLRHDLA